MRHRFTVGLVSLQVLGLCLAVVGCTTSPDGAPAGALVSVPVSYPIEREATDYKDFTARIAAVDSVEVRAHVWGYFDKVNFKEGALVKKGDVLFELDPRPYQAPWTRPRRRLPRTRRNCRSTRRSISGTSS